MTNCIMYNIICLGFNINKENLRRYYQLSNNFTCSFSQLRFIYFFCCLFFQIFFSPFFRLFLLYLFLHLSHLSFVRIFFYTTSFIYLFFLSFFRTNISLSLSLSLSFLSTKLFLLFCYFSSSFFLWTQSIFFFFAFHLFLFSLYLLIKKFIPHKIFFIIIYIYIIIWHHFFLHFSLSLTLFLLHPLSPSLCVSFALSHFFLHPLSFLPPLSSLSLSLSFLFSPFKVPNLINLYLSLLRADLPTFEYQADFDIVSYVSTLVRELQ